MRIIIDNESGFCFGVENAVNIAKKATQKLNPKFGQNPPNQPAPNNPLDCPTTSSSTPNPPHSRTPNLATYPVQCQTTCQSACPCHSTCDTQDTPPPPITNPYPSSNNPPNDRIYCLGNLVHNQTVLDSLQKDGLQIVESIDQVPNGSQMIIRAHGEAPLTYTQSQNKNIQVLDSTCVFVKKIHKIVQKYYNLGYQVLVFGKKTHAETIGINGWCNNSAIIIQNEEELDNLLSNKVDTPINYQSPNQPPNSPQPIPKLSPTNPQIPNLYDHDLCIVSQTTMKNADYQKIIEKVLTKATKKVEYFDTICYTTNVRQNNAILLSNLCDTILVIGSSTSSNTNELYKICKNICKQTYLIEDLQKMKNIKIDPAATVGIVAGASTPKESIEGVVEYMSKELSSASSVEFLEGLEETFVNYEIGKRVKGIIIEVTKNGLSVQIGGKLDGLIKKEDFEQEDGVYDPAKFRKGMEIEAQVISKKDPETNCILLSKFQVDKQKISDKLVESVRDGREFDVTITKFNKGGIESKYGSYIVFIPASHIGEFFHKDLQQFVGKTMRVVSIGVDDRNRKITASAKNVLLKDKKSREEIFWSNVQPGMIISGTVKRFTEFGAFISVDGIDCLCHNVDLSYSRINNPANVVKIGETYDFLVLSMDKASNRIALGYKQLKADPFMEVIEKYTIGSDVMGKVTRIVQDKEGRAFGAVVEIENGVDGLVHVSEVADKFISNINEAVKVGQQVKVRILGIDPNNKRINLSIKAAIDPMDEIIAKEKNKKDKKGNNSKDTNESDDAWSEESQINPFANLLKDMDVTNQ